MKKIRIWSIWLLHIVLLIPKLGFGQPNTSEGTLEVTGRILDATNGEPLAYATVYDQTSGRGTVSDSEGNFLLRELPANYHIRIDMLGYESVQVERKTFPKDNAIRLKPQSTTLEEVVVYGENDFLYGLVAKSRRTESREKRQAKTYYLLETMADDITMQIMECYYNGTYWGYDLEDLDLKNGRIALNLRDQRFFNSEGISTAFNLQKLIERSTYFPINPLQMSKRLLKKTYKLKLFTKFQDEKERTIYGINYDLREEDRGYFEGKIWIDSTSRQIQKITLERPNARIHPFEPIVMAEKLLQVDLHISKTFDQIEGDMYLRSLDFAYDLVYRTRDGKVYEVTSKAILNAYDFNHTFPLPFFDFSNVSYQKDYRKINASVYNEWFWKNRTEFTFPEKADELEALMKQSNLASWDNMFQSNTYFPRSGLLEKPYIKWSKNRIRFINDLEKTREEESFLPGNNKYQLKAHIYLDINATEDSIQIVSATVMDPYTSYYLYESTPESNAFINMYFDIMEIQRRKLVENIQQNARTVEDARSMYTAHMVKAADLTNIFFKEVDRGYNKKSMLRWNKLIKENLGTDNIQLFWLTD